MTTFEGESLTSGIRAAMQTLKDRQARFEDGADPDSHVGQYKLGKADAFGDAIGLLEEMTGVSPAGLRIQPPNAHMRPEGARWLAQNTDDPFEVEL